MGAAVKEVQLARDMAADALATARRDLAVAERASILVDAMLKTGRAEVIYPNGQRCPLSVYSGGGTQQTQWNIYYTCRDYASLSIPLPKLIIKDTP